MTFGTPRWKSFPRPKYLWCRYYFVKADDGFAIIDRMSSRYSKPDMWIEEIKATFGKAVPVSHIQKIVNQLNRDWHEEIRRNQCQHSIG